jgi:hypothetical protein
MERATSSRRFSDARSDDRGHSLRQALVTRGQVLSRATSRMARTGGGRIAVIGSDEFETHQLVLTFDDGDVLRRHSLLRLR